MGRAHRVRPTFLWLKMIQESCAFLGLRRRNREAGVEVCQRAKAFGTQFAPCTRG